MIDTALPPIVGEQPKVLILGSMPSQASLKHQEYYAHPQNSFWWIMSELYDFKITLSYSERCKVLNQQGVAVWDVLHQCRRAGSLDSAIERQSERANDFISWLKTYSSIRSIVFNGTAALKLFKRHYAASLESDSITLFACPSTSPAYAAMAKRRKLEIWKHSMEQARR